MSIKNANYKFQFEHGMREACADDPVAALLRLDFIRDGIALQIAPQLGKLLSYSSVENTNLSADKPAIILGNVPDDVVIRLFMGWPSRTLVDDANAIRQVEHKLSEQEWKSYIDKLNGGVSIAQMRTRFDYADARNLITPLIDKKKEALASVLRETLATKDKQKAL